MILRLSPIGFQIWGAGEEGEPEPGGEPTGKLIRTINPTLTRVITSFVGAIAMKLAVRIAGAAMLLLAMSGCAIVAGEPLSEVIKAVGTSRSTLCVTIDAMLYGTVKIVGSSAGAAIVLNNGDCQMQHQRAPVPTEAAF